MSSRLSVYHVRVRADGTFYTVGACAFSKAEAAALVVARLRSDGYVSVGVDSAGRVAPAGTWDPGATLVYGEVES